jgi:hypothetical protein
MKFNFKYKAFVIFFLFLQTCTVRSVESEENTGVQYLAGSGFWLFATASKVAYLFSYAKDTKDIFSGSREARN